MIFIIGCCMVGISVSMAAFLIINPEVPRRDGTPVTVPSVNDTAQVPSSPKRSEQDPVASSKMHSSSCSSKPDVTHREDSADQLFGVNKLRVDYDLGTCRDLKGNVSVVLFYMDDFESSWTTDEIKKFTEQEIEPALVFLEIQAMLHGVKLNLSIKQSYSSLFYDDEVILDVAGTGLATIDVLSQAARGLDYFSDEEMISDFRNRYETEVVCFTIFNKNGISYAINPHRGETIQIEEHCIIFAYDLNSDRDDPIGAQSSVVVHEMLHLFGAEDLYTPVARKTLAREYYPDDIMLGANYYIITNNIGEATAFYIGWTDEVPAVFRHRNW